MGTSVLMGEKLKLPIVLCRVELHNPGPPGINTDGQGVRKLSNRQQGRQIGMGPQINHKGDRFQLPHPPDVRGKPAGLCVLPANPHLPADWSRVVRYVQDLF